MNFSFYIYGTPNGYYDQFPNDYSSELFQQLAQNQQADFQMSIYRKGPLIYYTCLHYDLQTKNGNKSAFIGISLIFNGICFLNTQDIFALFNKLFLMMAADGEIIQAKKNSAFTFITDKFAEKQAKINEYKEFLQGHIDHASRWNYITLDTSFDQSNTEIKTLPYRDGNENILEAIRKFQQVIIPSQHKSKTLTISIKSKPAIKKWRLSSIFIVLIILAMIIFPKIKNDDKAGENVSASVVNYSVDLLPEGVSFIYSGEWKNNMPNGTGTATYDEGIYEGAYMNGRRHGKGTMRFSNGFVYKGDFLNDKGEGYGEIFEPNGDHFVGEIKNNQRHGEGILYNSQGQIKDSGIWKNNKKQQ
ncbi:MAG: hypothetical protein LBH19_02015 [Dysgonamonadaceae bacterium]|jgi:acyl-CoA-binding protein|nr:hypothetical protein [Dysgonamonadaceae bacterium]